MKSWIVATLLGTLTLAGCAPGTTSFIRAMPYLDVAESKVSTSDRRVSEKAYSDFNLDGIAIRVEASSARLVEDMVLVLGFIPVREKFEPPEPVQFPIEVVVQMASARSGIFLEGISGKLTLSSGTSILPANIDVVSGPCVFGGARVFASVPFTSGFEIPVERNVDRGVCISLRYSQMVDPTENFRLEFGNVGGGEPRISKEIVFHFVPTVYRVPGRT